MLDRPFVSTKYAPERYGGLLICGLNYGIAKGEISKPEAESKPWGEYFTHDTNRKGDPFVRRFALWFEWWGIPLDINGTPTELNLAISQTNLFYDSYKLKNIERSEEENENAFERLKIIIKRLSISGLLLASPSMADLAQRNLSLPNWNIRTAGRFDFCHSSIGNLYVAICPHPSGSPQSRRDVESLGGEMRDWVGSVLKEYNRKQPGQLLDPLSTP